MDHFQSIVEVYLRADRCVFINSQFCLQLNDALNPDTSGPHWYVDILAVDFRRKRIFLCEISYEKSLDALLKRFAAWRLQWPAIKTALHRDSRLPVFDVRPWAFIPEEAVQRFVDRTPLEIDETSGMPIPLVTNLEDVLPWKYRSWNRLQESEIDEAIPNVMRF